MSKEETKPMNARLLTLSAALLAALPLAASAQTTTAPTAPPVTLRYKWTQGEVRRYKMTMDMNMAMTMSGLGPKAPATMPAFASHMVMAYDTMVQSVNPADGAATLTKHITQMTGTLNGQPMPGISAMPSAYKGGFTVVMSPAGKVLSMQLPPAVAGKLPPGMDLSKMGSMVPAILPDTPTQVGDTWQSSTTLHLLDQMPGMPSLQTTVFSTLTGISAGTRPIADIHQTMQGTLGGAVPAGAAGAANLAGQFHADTLLKFDVNDGSVAGQDGTTTMNADVAMPNVPAAGKAMRMRMQMQMTTHLERLPSAP